MNDEQQNHEQHNEQPIKQYKPTPPEKRGKSKPFKTIITAVGVGVISSVLTLGVVFNTDFLPATAHESGAVSGQTENLPITQTSAKVTSAGDLTAMIEKASSAIVGVVNYQQAGNRFAGDLQDVKSGTGSGVVYKINENDAYIVTNNHVIEGAQKVEVSVENGETIAADVVGSDALTDLAVLRVDAKSVDYAMPFANSDTLKKGERVVAIGNPLGLEFSGSVTEGIISATNRTISVNTSAGEWALDVIQTDAAINPGNSGGALVNQNGEVVGINSLKIAQDGVEGIGFAIPSNDVIPLVDEMIENGKIDRPYLGIQMANLSDVPMQYTQHLPQSVEGGVILAAVEPNSPASIAGLQSEDIITEINEQEILNTTDLRKILYTDMKIGEKVTVTIYRGTQKQQLKLTLNKK